MPPTELSPLLNVGAIGAVLLWFMFKSEPRLRGIEDAIDRASRALLLAVVAIESLNPGTRAQVENLLAELDKAEAARK